MPVGSTSWYPDSGASNNVCHDASTLRDSSPYSGKSALLMGDGSPTTISSIGNLIFPTMTREILLTGYIRDGLYHFSILDSSVQTVVAPYAAHIGLQNSITSNKFCMDTGDWGGEYRTFASGLANQGIVHRLSCPHTSEQNSMAKRKHMHIVEMGVTILAQTNLFVDFCAYAFCCAVHLINRFPTVVLIGQNPYRALHGQDPTSQYKGYQCLLLDGKVIISRHVVFDEHQFLSPSSTTPGSVSTSGFMTTFVPLVKTVSFRPVKPSSDLPSSSCSPADVGSDREPQSFSSLPGADTDTLGSVLPTSNVQSFPPVQDSSLPLTDTHSMVTRSKAGIFKPKALTIEIIEPNTIEEAFSTTEWRTTAQAEFDALINNSTWDLVSLPPNRKAIGCKWLFKVKKNPDGTIARRKAQLVTKGCSQIPGYDFKETFSLVIKPTTIQVILSVSISKGWQLHQVDVNNAFLNGDLADEKALYGLRQAPHDIIITESVPNCINKFVQQLNDKFSLKDMGDLHYFLWIEVTRSSTGCLHLFQKKYIRELLERSFMSSTKSVHTPMVSSSTLSKDDEDQLTDPTEYRSLASALQYIVLTRTDIAYTMNRICQFMHAPTSSVVSHSTAEAEYRSLVAATSDVTWFVSLLKELQLQSVYQPTIWYDNSSVIVIAANPVLHSKFKHVELDLFFIREKVTDGSLHVGEVLACDQVADILTKPLSVSLFTRDPIGDARRGCFSVIKKMKSCSDDGQRKGEEMVGVISDRIELGGGIKSLERGSRRCMKEMGERKGT
ncbi:hypothetical protein CXB51_007951 [Gossypium anomalum]|uniref:Integrase catalytic domain-containing protein n=1 Tax=Gossypium anomalum TaxID=47600 RepID=A0A8J6DA31_9ROSI|nr:hypothetical protein CXB51_007951 [Gossypium anomalum]